MINKHSVLLSKLAAILFVAVSLVSCKKDKVPTIPLPEPTKAELISGEYKVYDTTGVYLYDIKLTYYIGPITQGVPNDSIYFENIDGEFTFYNHQGYNPSNPKLYIDIGYQDTLYDSNNKRWKLIFSADNSAYNNVLKDDTIRMIFRKTNINYWIEDVVPYHDSVCKQIAVKQH